MRSHDFCLGLWDSILNVISYHPHLEYFYYWTICSTERYMATEHKCDPWQMGNESGGGFYPSVQGGWPQLQQGDCTAWGRGLELLKPWGSPLRSSALERRRGKQSSASQWSLLPEQAPVCSVVCKLPVWGAPCGEAAGGAVLRAYRGPRLEDDLRTLYSEWEDLTKCSAYEDPRGLA